jgi:MFS family permease
VLGVLILVYLMSQIDRQILTVLAPVVRSDLHLTDAQLGLLYGTVFALFYGVFSVPLSKFADGWSRGNTLWIGLLFWSLMTMASGFASSFLGLALARVGVGIGEASANPAAVSLLGDYFEPERRSTVLGFYFVGGYLGIGASAMLGGAIAHGWESTYSTIAVAPFHLRGWQAAFWGVGIPGVVMALLVAKTVSEPRVQNDGSATGRSQLPLKEVLREIGSMLPPASLFSIGRWLGVRGVLWNATGLSVLFILVVEVIKTTDNLLAPARRPILFTLGHVPVTSNVMQWSAIGLSLYAIGSWLQTVKSRDPVAYRLTVGNKTFVVLLFANAAMALCTQSLYGFVFLYAHRYLGLGTESGLGLGAILALCSAVGVAAGGILGDAARRRRVAGRLHVAMVSFVLVVVVSLIEFTTSHVGLFYLTFGIGSFLLTPWVGCLIATGQDLVPPRMRGLSFALAGLMSTVIGLGFGPYLVGLISDVSGSLRAGVLSALISVPMAFGCLIYVGRHLEEEESSVATRAQLAGERSVPR